MTSRVANGVLVVDKPCGPTSHDVVARLRRIVGLREIGHAGTLDPMATGVLVLAVGEATKLVPWLSAHEKAYEATIALGVETDTLDAQGREVRCVPPTQELLAALSAFRAGEPVAAILDAVLALERTRATQVPPAFSALQHNGERSYARARRGEEFLLPARPIRVLRLELVGCTADPATISVALDVGKGYYVRALARDIGVALGTVGHLSSLRRTRSGCFCGDEALPLEAPSQALLSGIQPTALAAARSLPVARLTERGAVDARHGRRVGPGDIGAVASGVCAFIGPGGELVAVGEVDQAGCGKVVRGFGCRD